MPTSVQIEIVDGTVVSSSGEWYDLPSNSEGHIIVYAEESLSGTSVLYLRLEAKGDNSIIYTCLIKLTVN